MTKDDWPNHSEEEKYYGEDRKSARLKRKIASRTDRSKYKKTDQQKLAKQAQGISEEGLLHGRVISIISQELVVDCEGIQWSCFLRGALKKERTREKTLVAVGDFVRFRPSGEREGLLVQVEPRRSVLFRSGDAKGRKKQIIAANIDLVLITVSVVIPPLKPPLVDRYIIAASQGNMDSVVVVNKIDLLDQDPDEKRLYEEFLSSYSNAGVRVIPVSVQTGEGLDDLRKVMTNKASVFSGQSGVGKSSLINALTGLDLPVGEPVKKTRKGAHVTTRPQLVQLECGGWCVDTPGIKSFGMWQLEKDEIEGYFQEIHNIGQQCKYPNCSHTHEPDCAVLAAVEEGRIAKLRLNSYLQLLQSMEEEQRGR